MNADSNHSAQPDLQRLLTFGESEYQRWLQQRLEGSGCLGDVFPLMVSRNVPQYLLRKLWPEMWARFERAPHIIMFGAAEEGWRGRLDNLQARCTPADDAQFRVRFRKTYVMECESLLVLARPDDGSDGVVLVWIERPGVTTQGPDKSDGESGTRNEASDPCLSGGDQTWTQRTEAGLSMDRSGGAGPVHHYIVEGDLIVPAERVLAIPRRSYATVATQLPRREITSMALLAAATLRRAGARPEASPELHEKEERLLNARDGVRLSGGHMQLARDILNAFFAQAKASKMELHPLWDRIREMADQAR